MPKKTTLGEATSFTSTPAYAALTDEQKKQFVRNDAFAAGYAWGRHDQGHPAIVSLNESEPSTTSATVWAFGSLYARMHLELNDATHPRNGGLSVQGAWEEFAKTGCPDGNLPQHMS
jgi:hypothetical protein